MGLCPWNYTKEDNTEAVNRILIGKPPKEKVVFNDTIPYMKFLVFNDIHADPKYIPHKSIQCGDPVCCRDGNLDVLDGDDSSWEWGTPAHCDLPYKTLDHFLEHATEKMTVDSLIWLGDNPGHNVWEQHEGNHLEVMEHITGYLKNKAPSLGQVYPVLGNHEGYPSDQFDIYSDRHNWILEKLADMWKMWLTSECIRFISLSIVQKIRKVSPTASQLNFKNSCDQPI
jgi:sphingomyelin phosphodiesterase